MPGAWGEYPGPARAGLTASADELNKTDDILANAYQVVCEQITFTEAGDTSYTGTVTIPAGSTILDIIIHNVSLWDDGTSALMTVGNGTGASVWYTSTDLKATVLTDGQELSFFRAGGVGGANLTEGTSTHTLERYDVAATSVIGVVTTGGQDGSAGVTHMLVYYVTPTSSASIAVA